MGFPKSFKLYMDKSNLQKYLYWINKGRVTYAKGAVYEIGKWFSKCVIKAAKKYQETV
jgi:hypothetical protein